MRVIVGMWIGGIVSIVLMVTALWAWSHAAEVGSDRAVARPYVATWAVRSAAVAAGAAAQAVLLVAVVGRMYRQRGIFDHVLRLSAVLVCVLALVGAVALGLAGR